MSDRPIKVDELGLVPKTVQILRANGLETLDDLLSLDNQALFNEVEGLSAHRARKVRECIDSKLNLGSVSKETYSISSFLNSRRMDRKNIDVFVRYYASSDIILDDVAQEFGLTRERVRQICNKCLGYIRYGFDSGQIDHRILDVIDEAATKKTEIRMINISDDLLGQEGLVRAIVSTYSEEYEIVKSSKVRGQWLTRREDNVKNMIDSLSRTLWKRDTPMKLDNVLALYPINEDMLLSIKNIVIEDGCITLSTNKMTTGRIPRVRNYLLNLGRPASIQEIADATGMTLNQVRGTVINKDEFENVGKNVYDSVEANYLELSPSEMARNLLVAEDRAISVRRIVNYVMRYNYYGLTERDVLVDLFSRSEPIVRYVDGYVLLNEWGDDKIIRKVGQSYEVELKDAVRDVVMKMEGIFNPSMVLEEVKREYSDRTSDSINSVKAYLNTLSKDNTIVEVGRNTSCYRRPDNNRMV